MHEDGESHLRNSKGAGREEGQRDFRGLEAGGAPAIGSTSADQCGDLENRGVSLGGLHVGASVSTGSKVDTSATGPSGEKWIAFRVGKGVPFSDCYRSFRTVVHDAKSDGQFAANFNIVQSIVSPC